MSGGESGAALARLNAMTAEAAEAELSQVCGAPGWARAVAAARPFADRESLVRAGMAAWDALTPAAWIEGFKAHPRIGEGRRVAGGAASEWSRAEQAGMNAAGDSTRAELAAAQRAYEGRFGWTYIVCATGCTPGEMLTDCRARLGNEPDDEIAVAAGEERRIGRLRLERILAEGGER
ncbi:MAG TPA: 2-oxo-4-hydroxy-4-carboxy-5-ureidoimidazoline decarboxylase [Gemmatimonadota bacterium]